MKKGLRVVIVVALCVIIGLLIHNSKGSKTGDITNQGKVVDVAAEKIVFDKQSEVEVSSSQEVDSKIPVKACFDLKFQKDVTEEYVANTFSLKPKAEYEITKINTKYYQIKTTNELEEDQVYNVIEKTTEGTKKWAFQTEKIFGIDYTYPQNNSYLEETGVPEIAFNSLLDDKQKIQDYISIEPKIKGQFKKAYGYDYRFEPEERFEVGKTYTITIKEGLKDTEGNELKEEYTFKFSIQNNEESDFSANLTMLNRYRPGTPITLNLSTYVNMNKTLTIEDANVEIHKLPSKEKYLDIMQKLNENETIEELEEWKKYSPVYQKDLKEEIQNHYQEAKAKNRYYYSENYPIESNLVIDEEGYYLVLLTINGRNSAFLFQVNEASATCSVLSNQNIMILYKGKNNTNNAVDVYLNNEKLGTTNNNGVLYIEDFQKNLASLKEEFHYVEFKNGNTPFVIDITNQVYTEDDSENPLTSIRRFDNSYLYMDRNVYKVGETIHFWGYIRNRKATIDHALLRIKASEEDVLAEIPLTLSEVGTFETEFEINNVNDEAYITATIVANNEEYSTRYIRVQNYEMKQYQISVEPERREYINGETGIINLGASTYDGTPLNDVEFTFEINDYSRNVQRQKGSTKTDTEGNGEIKVPLATSSSKTNITPENVWINVVNSYMDGEQESLYLTVYPYKHYATGENKYVLEDKQYHLSFEEYLSLDKETPANDSIKVVAKAYKTVKTVTGREYNPYTKEMEEQYRYDRVAEPEYDKQFTVTMTDGKGSYTLPKHRDDIHSYYEFYAYLITDTGKELALNYDGRIYGGTYKTLASTTEVEEVEEVAPMINDELTYTLRYDTNDALKVGDEVYFYLSDNQGRRINDYSMFDFYTLVVSVAGNEIYHHQGEAPHFTFTEEMGANVVTYTLMYDSIKTYSPTASNMVYYASSRYMDYMWYPSTQISLCQEALSLDMEITFDKEVYLPSEEAVIKIKVTSKGEGVKAGVNLAALDSAYIDANGKVDTFIIDSLYNHYSIAPSTNGNRGITKGFATNSAAPMSATDSVEESAMGLGAGDGGGESESLREILKVTAFFESVVTDENGNAEIRVKLPDNITEWTVTAQAISKDFKAKEDTQKIKVSKDFYVTTNHKDRYLVGEKFAFNVKSFSKVSSGKEAEILVEILDQNGQVLEQDTIQTRANEVLSYQVQKPIEEKGIYQIRLTGTCENNKDSLVDEFEVAESLLDATLRESIILKNGDTISIVSPKGYLYIVNKDLEKVLPTIFELSGLYFADRNDSRIIAKEASRILNNLCNGIEFDYVREYEYEADKNIFKVMKNSSDDARLALRMLATKSLEIYNDDILDKIENKLGEEAMLWAKVNIDQASLVELRNAKETMLKDTKNYTKEQVLYLALAFADIGSFDEAEELYEIVSESITENDEIEYELKVILAIKLNLKEREALYTNYLSKDALPEHRDFVKLYYIQNAVAKNYKKGLLKLNINGTEEEIEVKGIGFTRKLISRKDTIKVVSMTDNLSFMLEQYKPVEFENVPKKGYIVSKKYSKDNAKEGEIVTVTITIDNKKLYEDGIKYGCKVEDAIPNNMAFVEYLYGESHAGYLRNQNGQKLTIGFWNPYDPKYNASETKSVLTYRARVTNGGEQFEPGTILLQNNNELIDGIQK